MLSGDIQTRAIDALMAIEPDLQADIVDLPHHGSFVTASPRWLDAVRPAVALQSTRPFRMTRDRWPTLLERYDSRRMSTADYGLVEVIIDAGGAIQAAGHLPQQGPSPPPP
jgi:competence protein ComEC